MPSTEPSVGLELTTPRPRPEPRSRVGHLTNGATQQPQRVLFVYIYSIFDTVGKRENEILVFFYTVKDS